MKKTLPLLVGLIFSFFVAGISLAAVLTGTLTVSKTQVVIEESFTVAVFSTGPADETLIIDMWENGSAVPPSKMCETNSVGVCPPESAPTWNITKPTTGNYTYKGVVNDTHGNQKQTNAKTVIVAATEKSSEEVIQIENPLTATSFEMIIDNIIDFIFKIAVVLAPLMVIVGGFLLLTAGGNIQQISRARNLLIWTAVGFLIVLLSKGVLAIINQILGVKGG